MPRGVRLPETMRTKIRNGRCPVCGTALRPLWLSAAVRNGKRRTVYCSSKCKNKAHHRRAFDNPITHERIQVNQKRYNAALRMEAIYKQGGKCVCCGETTFEFLALHHVLGHGEAHRRKISVWSFLKWASEAWQPELDVLCHNCHGAITYFGSCPHQQEEQNDERNIA